MVVGELSNGIRFVHEQGAGEVFHLGIFINAGTRDEPSDANGVAHFAEHLLFKGTTKHTARYIINRLEEVGGDIDAYTTKEDTAIYASFLNKDFVRAASLFSEMLIASTFSGEEIKKEREVVIDEINSYLDTPSEQIFDDFEQMIFGSHSLSRNILGTIKSVKRLNSDDVRRFVANNYVASRMVISTFGNLPEERVRKVLEKYFGDILRGEEVKDRESFAGYEPIVQHQKRRGSYQSHCLIGGLCCSIADKHRGAMSMLINMLGGPAMNSILNMEIREKHGYTYNIEANYQPYCDTGVFSIYVGTDPKELNKTIELVEKELNKLCNLRLNDIKMARVIRQQCGQIAVSAESGRMQMLNNGKYLMSDGCVYSMDELFTKISSITSSEIMEVANMYFRNLSRYSIGE